MFKNILKEATFIFIFKVLGTLLFLYANILIAKNFGPEIFGTFNLYVTTIIFLSLISRMGLEFIVTKEITRKKDNVSFAYSYLVNTLLISLLFGVVVTISYSILNQFFNLQEYLDNKNVMYVFFTFSSLSIITIAPEILRIYDSTKLYSFFKNALFQIMFFIGIYLITYDYLHFSLIYIYSYSLIFTALLLTIYISYFFLKKNNMQKIIYNTLDKPNMTLVRTMFFVSVFLFLQGNIDLYMIKAYMSEKDVGFYSVVVKIASMLTFFTATLGNTIAPKLASNKENTKEIFQQTLKIIVLFTIPLLFFVFFFSTELLSLFGNKYIHLTLELRLIVIATFLNSIPIGYFFVMRHKESVLLKIVFISLLINIILNVLFIPEYGIVGAIIASIFSVVVWNFTSYSYMRNKNII